MFVDPDVFSLEMVVADKPPASRPASAARASSKFLVEMLFRRRIGTSTSRLFERRT
jgi:hypothetical protein